MNKTVLLVVLSFIFFTGNAQIVNEGVFTIKDGTSVYFKNDYTNKAGATHTNNGDLHISGNFTNNGTTTVPTSGTTYFDGSATDTQTIDGASQAIRFYNLTVNNTNASVKGLAVSDQYDLQVDNNVVLTSGDLRLMGEAQLIQKHSGASTNSGSGHLLKDQAGAQNAYRYNYWSSPVQVSSGENIVANFLKDGSTPNLWTPATPNFIAGYNGTNGSPIGLAAFWFYKYVDGVVDPYNTQDWVPLFTGTTPNTDVGSVMHPGQGYTMKGTNTAAIYTDSQNYTFKGKPNDGDYTLAISADKEYLVGNPFASALDANAFIDDNIDFDNGGTNPIIDGTLYFWHHWGVDTHNYVYYSAGYATYTKSGGTASTLHPDFIHGTVPGALAITPLQYIPVGQGFLVRSSGTAGGNITFKNSQRVFMLEGASSIPVKGTDKNTEEVSARIRLDYNAPNGRDRHLLLAFTNTATDVLDYGWDGIMIDQWPDDLYYTIGNTDEEIAIPYVIQGVGAFNINAEYPLVVKTATSGKHTIKIYELENFNKELYILDEKGNTHNLIESDFKFYTSTNEKEKHFKLVFKPASSPTDVQDNLNSFINTFYVKDEIIINNDQELPLTGLQVYNAIGQLVLQVDKNQLKYAVVHIPFTNFAKSAYVIKLQAENGSGTYKIINY